MKWIPLTRGYSTCVDDADYEELSNYNWCASITVKQGRTYVHAMRGAPLNGKYVHTKMHRVIMGVTNPKIKVDHEDHDSLNNRRYNLRVCTNAQNARNARKKTTASTSQYKGVHWHTSHHSWVARITIDRRVVNLGDFGSEREAAQAYNNAALKLHGEFSHLNILEAACQQ